MKNIFLPVLVLFLVTSCADHDDHKLDEGDFRAEVVNKAGASAHNCGDFELGGERTSVDECVTQYFGNAKPFYATYQMQGIDSISKYGFAFNSQLEMYLISYDSDPSGGSNVGGSVYSRLCESPQIVSPDLSEEGSMLIRCGD